MSILARLQQLEKKMGSRPQMALFKLERGGSFRAECDPLSYLLQNGVETPRGRIVGIDPPAGDIDPLSASLYETINEVINDGKERIYEPEF